MKKPFKVGDLVIFKKNAVTYTVRDIKREKNCESGWIVYADADSCTYCHNKHDDLLWWDSGWFKKYYDDSVEVHK